MKVFVFLLFCCSNFILGQTLQTPYELSNKKRTATYQECANFYRSLNALYPEVSYFDSIGAGDAGQQIYTFRIYSEHKMQF